MIGLFHNIDVLSSEIELCKRSYRLVTIGLGYMTFSRKTSLENVD